MHYCFAVLDYPTTDSGGGVGTVTSLLADGLIKRGHEVSVIKLHNNFTDIFYDGNIKIYCIAERSFHYYFNKLPFIGKYFSLAIRELERSWSLLKTIKKINSINQIDIIEFSEEAGILILLSSFYKRTTIIARLHGTEFVFQKNIPLKAIPFSLKLQRFLQLYFLKRCKYLLGVSDVYRDVLAGELGQYHASRIIVLGNPVDNLKLEIPSNHSSIDSAFLFVGRIQDIKGVDILLKALAKIKICGHKVALNIAGNFHPSIPRIQFHKMLCEYNLVDDVHLIGHVPRDVISLLMKQSLAVVVPSHFETFGMTGIEALQSGANLIHTRTGIFTKLSDLSNLKLINSNDVNSLKNAMLYFLNQSNYISRENDLIKINEILELYNLEKQLQFYESIGMSLS